MRLHDGDAIRQRGHVDLHDPVLGEAPVTRNTLGARFVDSGDAVDGATSPKRALVKVGESNASFTACCSGRREVIENGKKVVCR